jgi:hypothetical protein
VTKFFTLDALRAKLWVDDFAA